MRAPPICRNPVGEGANRVTMGLAGAPPAGDPVSELALNRACSQTRDRMATIAEGATSTHIPPLQTAAAGCSRVRHKIEDGLQAERDQLPLWLPVALGIGVIAWFALAAPVYWIAAMTAAAGVALGAIAAGRFDLDHLGPKIRKNLRTKRSGKECGEVQNTDTIQRLAR